MAYSKTTIYLTMAGMVLSGASSGIIIKLTDSTFSLGEYFHHPYFQTVPMFLGEILGFIFVWIDTRSIISEHGSVEQSPEYLLAVKSGKTVKFNKLILAIPMLCDCLASVTLMIGYINIAASIAQMIGSLIVFVTALEAILFLNKTLFRHHWVGASGVVIGICLVALSAITTQNEAPNGNAVLGVIGMILSAFFQGTQFAIEERMMDLYYLSPFEFAGWEGLWGLILMFGVLPILQYIPCDSKLCHGGYVENSVFALEQLYNSPTLIFLLTGSMLSIGVYNGLGLAVTKMVSATNRVVLRQIKIVVIWLFFLFYPYEGNESFKVLQSIGFIVLVFGVFLYNEVIVIHMCGLADHLLIKTEEQDADDSSFVEFENVSKTSEV